MGVRKSVSYSASKLDQQDISLYKAGYVYFTIAKEKKEKKEDKKKKKKNHPVRKPLCLKKKKFCETEKLLKLFGVVIPFKIVFR